jgi:hypothetical protein
MLSLLSMATHNATLLALVRDFRRDWVLRWLRQFLMFANLMLSCVYGVYVLQAKIKGLDPILPISCAWKVGSSGAATEVGSAFVGTIATIAGNVIVFTLATWYLHSRTQRFFKAIQLVGLVLMAVSAIGAGVRAMLLSQAFGTPDTPLSDEGEKQWSFGQLLGLLLLLLPLVSAIEISRGMYYVALPFLINSNETTRPRPKPPKNTKGFVLFTGRIDAYIWATSLMDHSPFTAAIY